jgi:hypothetical protein
MQSLRSQGNSFCPNDLNCLIILQSLLDRLLSICGTPFRSARRPTPKPSPLGVGLLTLRAGRRVAAGTDRIARAGPPSGGPVRSIRKNSVLPGSCSTDHHYGKHCLVLSGVERTGPIGGGPARVARRWWAGGGRERGTDRATRTRSAEPTNSVHDRSCRVSHGVI